MHAQVRFRVDRTQLAECARLFAKVDKYSTGARCRRAAPPHAMFISAFGCCARVVVGLAHARDRHALCELTWFGWFARALHMQQNHFLMYADWAGHVSLMEVRAWVVTDATEGSAFFDAL